MTGRKIARRFVIALVSIAFVAALLVGAGTL